MAKVSQHAGTTTPTLTIFIADTSKTDGSGLTGLAYNTSGLTCAYKRDKGTAAVSVTLVDIPTPGTYVSGGFKEISASLMPGCYEFHPPVAAYASGATNVVFMLKGASNMAVLPFEVELTAVDNQNATTFGVTNLVAPPLDPGTVAASPAPTTTTFTVTGLPAASSYTNILIPDGEEGHVQRALTSDTVNGGNHAMVISKALASPPAAGTAIQAW